jgi:hypothetical protein
MPGESVGGDDNCSEVRTCLEGCEPDDTMCVTVCVSNVCDSSRTALNSLLSCKNTSCRMHCEDWTADLCTTCLDLNCGDQVAACAAAGC